jgi:BirA family biotin operon repressor/biotin-[acetyl-CoA-carboxylase] ligase
MVVYTDSIPFAEQILPQMVGQWSSVSSEADSDIPSLRGKLFNGGFVFTRAAESDGVWNQLFVVESAPHSQYDTLIELNREGQTLPEGILCVAGEGNRFHGFKNRPWTASPGNLHVSVNLAPSQPINHFGAGFMILAAVSVIDAIDTVSGLESQAGIKWVNDILINDAKVCGVLAYTQTKADVVTSAVLGIGLNVETTPDVPPTPTVPKVGSLCDVVHDRQRCNQAKLLDALMKSLDRNYRSLLDGNYEALLNRYGERSVVMGRDVEVLSDDPAAESEVLAKGRVESLGQDLELLLEGHERPISKGRLVLK